MNTNLNKKEDYTDFNRELNKKKVRKQKKQSYSTKSKENERDEFGYINGRILPMLPKSFTMVERSILRKKEMQIFKNTKTNLNI